MAWEEKRGKEERGPEQERDPGRNTGPFTSDGEYDSLEAWADEVSAEKRVILPSRRAYAVYICRLWR